jgi:hypothetical protein
VLPFVGQQKVSCVRCPLDASTPGSNQMSADPEGYGVVQSWGACSYACNYLVFGNLWAVERVELHNPDQYDPKAVPQRIAPSTCARLPGPNPDSDPGSFADGISNTFLFAEKMADCQWTRGATGSPLPGGNLWAPSVNNAQWAPAFAMESPWHDGTKFQLRPWPSQCNVGYPSTGHYEGLIVDMADASCRTVSPRISSETFYALCTPNGGDRIGPDWEP